MPIAHSDRIGGTIYIIASGAEEAQRIGLEYLRTRTTDEFYSYGVHDDYDSAYSDLHNRYNRRDTDREKVYAFTINIRIAEKG